MSSGTGSKQFSGTGDVFGITARPIPADQARYFQAHLGVATATGGAMVAMQGDIDRRNGVPCMRMARLFDHAEDLVAGGEFGATVPELEIGAAERGPRHPHQHFPGCGFRDRNAFDRDPVAAVKDGRLHHGVGELRNIPHRNPYPFTAPSVSPDTSQR